MQRLVPVARYLFGICILTFGCGAGLFSQREFLPLQRLSTEDGLSQDLVVAIGQDSDGFIWFGTSDGLTRFDGRHCTVYRFRPNDDHSIPDNRISGITSGPDGKLWISTFKGICYLDPADRRLHRMRFPSPLDPKKTQDQYFSEISFDKAGIGWTVTDSFLMRFDPRNSETAFYEIPCRTKTEIALHADSHDRVWITVVGQHLLRFDVTEKKFTYVRGIDKPNGAANPWPMMVKEDNKGLIWNSDWDQAFYYYDENAQQFVNLPDSAGLATVFLFDNKDSIAWIGGGGHGLWRMNMHTLRRTEFPPDFRNPYAHNNSRTYALYRDPHTGIIWIGTELGVEYYDPNALKFAQVLLPEKPGQSQFYSVSDLCADPSDPDKYWLSVWAVGLFEWSRSEGKFRLYDRKSHGLYSNELFEIAPDAEGNLWLATLHGLERFDPKTGQSRHFPQPAPANSHVDKVLCVAVAPDGAVWGGNNRGMLFRVDPRTGERRLIPLYRKNGTTFPFYTLWNIRFDNKGRVMASSPNGLFRYDPASGTTEQLLDLESPRYVADALQTPDKRLYIGTVEGVFVLDARDSLLLHINDQNGLLNQNIRHLDVDPQGNIWIATVNGLHRYEPVSGRVDYYSRTDGLFVNNLEPGFCVLPNGELFVSGEYSFNIARYDQLKKDMAPPRLSADKISIADRSFVWQPGQEVVLNPGESTVAIDIAVIHFTHPEKVTLSYMLQGFSDTWTDIRQPVITYTNLDGGRYTLLVRARNGDGVWSTQTLEIPLRVIAPFYKTWWFRAAIALLLLGIVAAITRYRIMMRRRLEAAQNHAKELEKQQLLNEIALLKTQVNPHFLFNSLSILSSLVRVDADLSEQFIDQLSRSYRYILEQKEQSQVTLRTEMEFIRSYAFLLKIRFEHKFDLRVHLSEEALDQYKIAPLTLQLLIENAVKHNRMSAKEPLYIDVRIENERLVVQNPLQERSTTEPSTGTGLNNIISRYALLTDRPVWAGKTDDGFFVVKIPLL